MTLSEFYKVTGGSYDNMLSNLGTDDCIKRFLKMFPNDPSFSDLEKTLASNDFKEAFRHSHTLKGVCMNLELKNLQEKASELTENLRDGIQKNNISELFNSVRNDYISAIEAINNL